MILNLRLRPNERSFYSIVLLPNNIYIIRSTHFIVPRSVVRFFNNILIVSRIYSIVVYRLSNFI